MRNLDYFKSERFIHDDLAERAAAIAEQVRETWRKTQTFAPYAVTWPNTDVKADDGRLVTHACICVLPPTAPSVEHIAVLRKMVDRTKAYGLVLVDRQPGLLRVLFETQHGARAWLMPLERHGDVTVCGAPEVQNNATCVGLLWQTAG